MTIIDTGVEIDTPYEDLLRRVRETGVYKQERTGTGTLNLFGTQFRYDLSKGFPLLTTKRVPFEKIAYELLWFLMGESNIRYLLQNDVHIWSEWPFKKYLERTGQKIPVQGTDDWDNQLEAFEQQIVDSEEFSEQYGDLGPIYGVQWRKWKTTTGEFIDQIAGVVEQIKKDPNSRRLIVDAWNPEFVPVSALPPCHVLFQFDVTDGKLSCELFQRSADMFLGVPFNIASYALLTHMVAQQCDLEVGDFVWTGGSTHVYVNHLEQVDRLLGREPFALPKLEFARKPADIFSYTINDFVVVNYKHHPGIKAPVAV